MNINEDLIKAREIVAGYKQFNQKTVERIKTYDPSMKIWTFEKTSIDPNAGEFKKKYYKTLKKQIKPKSISSPKTKKITVKKIKHEKKQRPTGLKYHIKTKTQDSQFKEGSLIYTVYNYYLEGKNRVEIGKLINRSIRTVSSMIRTRKIQLGIELTKNETHRKVIELSEQGLRVVEIADKLNLSKHNISYHIQRFYKSKDSQEIKIENDEILFHMKRIAKLHQKDYCYNTWISQAHCKMKSNLTTPTRNKRCKELEKEGKIIEIKEGFSKSYGIMYKIV